MDNLEEASVINPMNGLGEAQCVDDTRFTQPDCVGNGEIFGNSDGSSSSETETEAEPLEDYPSAELVDNDESMTPASPLDSARKTATIASEDVSDQSTYSSKAEEEADQIDYVPDFLIFNNIYARNSVVIFSENCVDVKGLDACTDQNDFEIQFRLDDIISIESIWLERTQTAMVKIRVILEGSVEAESDNNIADIKELKFAVTDSSLFEKREEIISLNKRYDALWISITATELDEYGDMRFPASYIPSFDPFEDFIYPEGDSDAVSISKRDVDLLEPDTFVNDTIIDFYIKYLKDQIPPDKRQRYHFFNSFFFRKLGDLEKYPSSSFDGRAAFLRVRKWTRKVNLFEKDFVFVPINNHYHWSLVVICHPGEISTFRDVDMGKLAKVPCILHMDSIRGTHLDLECRIRSYLWEEWKERQKEASEDVASKFSNLRFVSLELPQQQNCFDCGLFLLHYVELFLDEDPVGINPFKITKINKFLNADWFPSAEPSLKRRAIQNLIHNLLENHSQENAPATGSNKVFAANINTTENTIEFLSGSFGQGKGCNGDLTCSQAKERAELTVFPTSLGGSLCTTDRSGVSAGDLFESGLGAQSSIDVQYHTFDRTSSFDEFKNAVVSIQEAVETCGTYDYFEPKENGFHSSVKIKTEAHEFPPSPSTDYNTQVSWDQELCLRPTSCANPESLPITSICNDNALEVHGDETCQHHMEIGFNELHQTKHISAENDACLGDSCASAPVEMVAVAESDYSVQGLDQNDKPNSPEARQKNASEDSHHCNSVGRRRSSSCDDSDDMSLDSDVQHAAKKLRLTTPSEECPKSLKGDLCL